MNSLSLDAAISLTTWSRRTWWRRISDGDVSRLADDIRGRAMLPWSAIQPRLCVQLTLEDMTILARADAGDATSQCDIGQLLFISDKYEAAFYWLEQAAEQGDADAMQWIGAAYANGRGVVQNESLALMWIAKAAANGHIIAKQQVQKLIS